MAEGAVSTVKKRLPPELRSLAEAIPVIYYDRPTEEILGQEFASDILGLFVGESHGADQGASNTVPAHILLFLENLLDEAEGELATFQEEVRLTYLHELGHYFGWGEDDLERRGLS